MELIRSAKYRLYPSAKQKALLHELFGLTRFTYNKLLEEVKDFKFGTYKKDETKPAIPSKITLIKEITPIKKANSFLYRCPNDYLQAVGDNIGRAFDGFYRKGGFPKFKSKKDSKQSFNMYAGSRVKIEDNHVIITSSKASPYKKDDLKIKFKNHKIKWNLGKITGFTISKDAVGDYWLSLTFKTLIASIPDINIDKTEINNPVGIDVGLKELLITSNGEIVKNERHFVKQQEKLKRLQQSLSKKKKGSNNRKKSKIKVAKKHRKVARQRSHRNHVVSRALVNIYDFICLEDLDIKKMIKNSRLAKSIADVAWGDLMIKLNYKAGENQVSVVKIDRFYPSSKTCSSCGNVKEDLKLSDRTYVCSECSFEVDRDLNAAHNILVEGLRLYGLKDTEIKELVRNTHELSKIKLVEMR